MRLARVRLVGVGPFDDLEVPFCDALGAPRAVTCVTGSGGVGKTTLLAAVASTRPGYCAAQPRPRGAAPPATPFVVADWLPSDDDPPRPHPVRLVSPNAPVDEGDGGALLRRREQALFDRRASEGGFVIVSFSAARWFSRSPVLLSAPDRTLARYDVRAPLSFDDAARADLTRETKQALAFAALAAALHARRPPGPFAPAPEDAARAEAFDAAMTAAVGALVRLAGFDYAGLDPLSLEPTFRAPAGGAVPFDDLPTGVRHLASFGAITLRALYAAYPAADPRAGEAVALIDEAGLHQEPAVQRKLVPTLRAALPRVQWVLTTSSPALADGCEPGDVLALRRLPPSPKVELFAGELATLH
jgi:hypothetical protein